MALADMVKVTQYFLASDSGVIVSGLSRHYTAQDVAITLGPLMPRIQSLGFDTFPFAPSEWREVEVLLRSVRRLTFESCELTAEMLALFAGSSQLQELVLFDCTHMEERFVDMATVRSMPLSLRVCPRPLSPHVVSQCIAAAECAHGAQYITFV